MSQPEPEPIDSEELPERALLEAIWEEANLLRQYFDSIDHPELIIYRMVPNRVRYMQEWALAYHEVPLG